MNKCILPTTDYQSLELTRQYSCMVDSLETNIGVARIKNWGGQNGPVK